MSDLPLVLSIASNVAIAGVAYLGSRQQNTTARHAIDAETGRANDARNEEHFRHRQAVYHDYLDTMRRLTTLVLASGASEKAMLEWRASYEHHLNAVALFATPEVLRTSEALGEVLRDVTTDSNGEAVASEEAVRSRFRKLQPEFAKRLRETVGAMRVDVAR